ncbi:MAG: NAD(P)/FAD-dependent oxidoreductase [Fimbriimonadaceae bacterium]|nr:NAD(P)/FAD-dependent oxidoreductase [Fimbriimonadaceae bacterium]
MVDALVVGAGPGGLAAAVALAECGLSVVVVDENPAPGGQIWRSSDGSVHHDARAWSGRARAAGVEFRQGCAVFDAPAVGDVRVVEGGSASRVRSRNVVLATGARELHLPFPGWTLPGVVGLGGLQALTKQGFPVRDRRVIVAGTGPLLLAVAAHVSAQGGRVVGVFEQASWHRVASFGLALAACPDKAFQGSALRLECADAPYRAGRWVVEAEGRERVERAIVTDGRRTESFPCDVLAVGYGLVPNGELARLLGCGLAADGSVPTDARCETVVPGVFAVGECAGVGGVDVALAEGTVAGLAIAGSPKLASAQRSRRKERGFARRLEVAFALRPELKKLPEAETIVCRCEDVRWRDLHVRSDWREAKLATRCGMGPCQGRVCGAALRFLAGYGPEDARPPLVPVPARCLAAFDTERAEGQE